MRAKRLRQLICAAALRAAAVLLAAAVVSACAGPAQGTPAPTQPGGAATAAPAQPAATAPAGADRVEVRVNARLDAGPFDRKRLLNGSVAAADPLAHLEWLPGAYPALADAGIRQVRLDHLTDDRFYRLVSVDRDGELAFDFSRLDAVVLPLFEHGLQPFFCLSYTPLALLAGGDGDETPAPPDGALPPPPDLAAWQEVVYALVDHYARAGHSGLYWEVWNEPDLDPALNADAQAYVALYRATAGAVKQADPTARVGGPADSRPGAPAARLDPLLAAAADDPSLPLDFVSYHKTADSDGDGLPPFDLEWGYDTVDFAVLGAGLPAREVIVSAWTLTPPTGAAGGLNDSHQAASAAAVMLFNALKYPNLQAVFYHSLIDGDPTRPLSGDTGLLSVSYRRKALYQLFQMIGWMGDTRLATAVRGEAVERGARHALAARDAGGQVTVLAWNNTPQAAILDLEVTGLPASGNWQAARYLIDEQHGGYLADLQAGLRGLPAGPGEMLAPLDVAALPVTERYARSTRLPPYSVSLLVLAPPDRELDGWPAPTRAARNLAAGQPVATSSVREAPGWFPQAAVDEMPLSLPGALGWSSAISPQPDAIEWIAVDLGQPYRIDQVVLVPRNDDGRRAGPSAGDGFPTEFRIQGALRPNQWVDLAVLSDYGPVAGRPQPFRFSAGDYQYVRVIATRLGRIAGRPGEFTFQLAELQIYEALR